MRTRRPKPHSASGASSPGCGGSRLRRWLPQRSSIAATRAEPACISSAEAPPSAPNWNTCRSLMRVTGQLGDQERRAARKRAAEEGAVGRAEAATLDAEVRHAFEHQPVLV